jgi:hypothetical protein
MRNPGPRSDDRWFVVENTREQKLAHKSRGYIGLTEPLFETRERLQKESTRCALARYLKRAKERPAEDLTAVRKTVSEIIEKDRSERDRALRYYSEEYWSPKTFGVSEDEIRAAKSKLADQMLEDIDFCQAHIKPEICPGQHPCATYGRAGGGLVRCSVPGI